MLYNRIATTHPCSSNDLARVTRAGGGRRLALKEEEVPHPEELTCTPTPTLLTSVALYGRLRTNTEAASCEDDMDMQLGTRTDCCTVHD